MRIDHVYTWVNPDDQELSELRAKFAAQEVRKDHEYRVGSARTADNGELKASLETAQKFLPFVRKTFIFGSGSPPPWLRSFGDSVIYIPQSDVIPERLWPSFLSDTVESFIYLIPGLSENYIYSNDDFFFARPHVPSNFFDRDGRPRIGLQRVAAATGRAATYRAVEENGIRALDKHVQLPRFLTKYPPLSDGPRLRSRLDVLYRRLELRKRGLRMVNGVAHTSQPYLKSAWTDFHQLFEEELSRTFAQKFRSEHAIGVNFVYAYYLQALGKADFYIASNDRMLRRSAPTKNREQFRNSLLAEDSKIQRFCLNDTPSEGEDGWRDYVSSLVRDLLARPN